MLTLDGRALAQKIRDDVKAQVASLPYTPGLGVILVGEDPASHLYVSLKERAATEAGIFFEKRYFSDVTPVEKIISAIQEFNQRTDIDAILVQVPMPAPYDEDTVTQTIAPEKDVDGFHPVNRARLISGDDYSVRPPVLQGVIELIRAADTDLSGKRAMVFANSELFGDLLAAVLNREGLKTEIYLGDAPANVATDADVIVVAKGKTNFLDANRIKDGAVVIDVGTNRLAHGRVIGDVDPTGLAQKRGWISPVPGGVGPMTVAILMKNVLTLAARSRGHF